MATIQDYVARKGSTAAKQAIRLIERTIELRLVSDEVPKAEISANLNKALGVPQGGATSEQAKAMDRLLKAASWALYEAAPNDDSALGAIMKRSNWSGLVKVANAIGANPPKLNTLAKRVARSILNDHIAPNFVEEEHGGEKIFAVNAVLEKLFPASKGDDPRTSREAYLRHMFDEMLAMLGG